MSNPSSGGFFSVFGDLITDATALARDTASLSLHQYRNEWWAREFPNAQNINPLNPNEGPVTGNQNGAQTANEVMTFFGQSFKQSDMLIAGGAVALIAVALIVKK